MNIEKVKINDLTYPKRNAKIHTPEQIRHIKKSIEKYGFNDAVGIWGNNNIIVTGNGRVQALKEMGFEEVDCVRLDHLSDDERREYALVHNQTSIETGFDFDILSLEFEGLESFDFNDFGFEFPEEDINSEAQEDNFNVDENIPDVPVSKIGDIYQLGKHRLICGDSTNKNHVSALMNGTAVDLVVTDPPYNINYLGSGDCKRKGILNDKMPEDKFLLFLSSAFENYADYMRDGAAGYCFYKETGNGTFLNALKSAGLKFNQQCVWIKNQAVLGGLLYQGMHEPFILFFKGKQTNKTWNGKRKQKSALEDIDFMTHEELIKYIKRIQSEDFGIIHDIARADKPLKSDLHPTMKPIKLLAKLINNSSNENNIVLDLFGGSGSTLIACEQLNRICYMSELDPKYVDVIIKRWEQFTGKKAAKLN